MSDPKTYATQLDAVERLQALGYKCGKSKFNADLKLGRIGTTEAGAFSEEALAAYGKTWCKRQHSAESPELPGLQSAEAQKTSADARLKTIEADRRQIKLDLERGLYILREDHLLELAARGVFFKTQAEIFANHEAAEIVAFLGADEAKIPALREFLRRRVSRWLAAYDTDREFRVLCAAKGGSDDDL